MIRLLILDVEGVITLPGGSQYPWPLEEMLQVRSRLQQIDAGCSLCTGRQVPYGEAVCQALDLFKPLPEPLRRAAAGSGGPALLGWPSILENGAYFYDPIAKRPFPHPLLGKADAALMHRMRVEALEPLMEATGANLDAGKEFCLSVNPPPLEPGGRDRQLTETFRPVVEAAIASFGEQVEVKHSASAIDITPRGVSKASAVSVLLDWLGIPPDQVAGVGDTAADQEWLQRVGWGAAPSNGRDVLHGLKFYASMPAADGLLEIIERLPA